MYMPLPGGFGTIRRLVRQVDRVYVAKLILIAIIYFIAAKLGLSLAFSTKQVTTIWPPTGIALAALLILGWRYWPGILLGAFIVNLYTSEPWYVAGGIGIGNTLEAMAGFYLLQRIAGVTAKNLLSTARNIVAYL